MRASSSVALGQAQGRWDPVVREAHDAFDLAGSIFAVADLLADNTALRRAMTDPSRSGEDRAALASRIVGGAVDGRVNDLVAGLARDRWSEDLDIVEALEILGQDTVLAAAERGDGLDALGAELLDVRGVISGSPELEVALAEESRDLAGRRELLARVMGDRVSPQALLIAQRAVGSRHERTALTALAHAAERAAERRARKVARVTAAVPLTGEQRDRLVAVLAAEHGSDIALHVDIDPAVIGGLRVEVGHTVLDGTVRTRLDEARRRIAG
ncbi:F0F1 ATP synthase subunit delta [Georgenia sp. Z1344]|uniref:F0F1 ATP synthase subunit delta n=1 Tax=Georgenia sp. Z1344 TaxID=3416706 RepID=UPI003CE8B618